MRLKYCSDFLFSIFRQFNCSVVVCDDERGDFLKRGTRRRKLVTIEGIGYDTFSSTEYSFYYQRRSYKLYRNAALMARHERHSR